jgi:hypothetical protein
VAMASDLASLLGLHPISPSLYTVIPCDIYIRLLRALKSYLGVSLCIRPLILLLFPPEASTALRRCCNARIACGVVGTPLLTEPCLLVLALTGGVCAVGVCAAVEPGVRTYILFGPAEEARASLLGVRCLGVLGWCIMRPSARSWGSVRLREMRVRAVHTSSVILGFFLTGSDMVLAPISQNYGLFVRIVVLLLLHRVRKSRYSLAAVRLEHPCQSSEIR